MEEDVLILANGYVLTCDPANRAGRLHCAIREGIIADLTADATVLHQRYPGARVLDVSDMLIVPGFVNAHAHSESLLLRELTAGLPLTSWASQRALGDAQKKLESDAETLGDLYRAAGFAHVKSGTTTVAEYLPPCDPDMLGPIVQGMGESGLRTVLALTTWEHIRTLQRTTKGGPRMLVSLGQEEDYTVYSLESRIRASRDLNCPPVAHIGEQRDAVEATRRNFQKDLLHLLRDFGALTPDTILLHLNHCTEEDARSAAALGCTVTLCLRSAVSKQTGYPFLRHLASSDLRLSLATDWGSFDVAQEMRLLCRLPSMIHGTPAYAPSDIVRMGTITAAKLLGMDDEVGSIEVGKRADIQCYALSDLRLAPPQDPSSAEALAALLVLADDAPSLTHVIVGGRVIVEDGALVTTDERKLRSVLQYARERLGMAEASAASEERKSARAKVIPFVPRGRDAQQLPHLEEVFPEGAGGEPLPPTPPPLRKAPDPPPPRRRSTGRPVIQPELPKDVRREFGDDEEV